MGLCLPERHWWRAAVVIAGSGRSFVLNGELRDGLKSLARAYDEVETRSFEVCRERIIERVRGVMESPSPTLDHCLESLLSLELPTVRKEDDALARSHADVERQGHVLCLASVLGQLREWRKRDSPPPEELLVRVSSLLEDLRGLKEPRAGYPLAYQALANALGRP